MFIEIFQGRSLRASLATSAFALRCPNTVPIRTRNRKSLDAQYRSLSITAEKERPLTRDVSSISNSPDTFKNKYPNFNLQGKTYIITGGGRGLGLVLAEAIAQAGADAHCFDRLPEPHPEFLHAQDEARHHQGSLHYHQVDVRENEQVSKLVSYIACQHGRIDGLVAAAGVQQVKKALDYTSQEVRRMFDVNYTGVFMSATAVAREMIARQHNGSIVLVASMSGMIANKGLISPVYNSSKAAVIQLTRNLAMEWGKHGIRVNALCPGHILTPMVKKNFEEVPGLRETWEQENMLGRLASPKEFTGATIFLLSDSSSFMTASNLVIDGGHTAW